MADAAVCACPIDVRRQLYGRMVLTGGTACVKSLSQRLKAEIMGITSRRLTTGAKVRCL